MEALKTVALLTGVAALARELKLGETRGSLARKCLVGSGTKHLLEFVGEKMHAYLLEA